MNLITHLDEAPAACEGGVCMCIGVFDGVHLGHRMLIDNAIRRARERGLRSLVFTFAQHPLSLLAPPYAPRLLTGPEEKARLIERAGVDVCLMLDFLPDFAAVTADEFLEKVIAGACRARHLTTGKDFRFGAKGVGNVRLLCERAPGLGIDVDILPSLAAGSSPVKSTRIRQCLIDGNLEEARRMLGRDYALRARVVAGDARGRTIGFPTANLAPPPGRLVPGDGVYAVRVRLGEATHGGMMNIGVRPTFQADVRTLEVHLFDYSGDLYGKDVDTEFVARVRDEKEFASAEELIRQLKADEATCRKLLHCATSQSTNG